MAAPMQYEYDTGSSDPYGDYSVAYDDYEDEEEMPATERELAEDAQWKLIQKNTFTRWANEHLKVVNKNINDLETDLSDGLRLLALVEVLSGHKFKKFNRRPNFRTQKLENVTVTLKFLEEGENIRIVNIDSTDIVDSKLKLILGLIWTLILHYSISMPMWEGEDEPAGEKTTQTPKQRLLSWVQNKLADLPVTNFTTNWNDGKAMGALVDSVAPGLCPDWEDWNPKKAKENATEAMDAAEQWLDVPQLIKPEEMINPKVDELSMMTYLSQYPNAKLKPGAPLRPKTNPSRVRAYGPGIEPTGNCVGAPARFIVETFSAGRGEVTVIILNPNGQQEPCEIHFNNDRNLTYSCVYTPTVQGTYKVIIKFSGQEIPKCPYQVGISGAPGDPSKVKCQGPGIEKSGVTLGKKTYFEVMPIGAGDGVVDVVIVDPSGNKDTVRPMVSKKNPEKWYVEYTPKEAGTHSVNVFFSGKPVPLSPFGVGVSPAGGPLVDPAVVEQPIVAEPVEGARAALCPPTRPQSGVPSNQKPAPFAYAPDIQPDNVTPSQTAAPPVSFKSMPSDAKKCYATGRGIQPKGVRIGDEADFKVHTKGAGVGELHVQVTGPDGQEMPCKYRKVDAGTFAYIYVPKKVGEYVVTITYGGQYISKAPFKVDVGPYMESKIRAYGPGLEHGMVSSPACFVVETNGETGALGFSIEGPSQAKIDCKDNGDGSADITYWPTAPGEYAVHILCNEEDIPKSPYMAEIIPAMPGVDATQVVATGPGLEKNGVTVNKWAEFSIDTRRAGQAPLMVSCMDADYEPVEVLVKDNKDGTFWCRYMPKKNVKHTVTIAYAGVAIPNSPFRVNVQEASNPTNVKVSGPAVSGPVKTFQSTYLIVDCSAAGPGDVAIALTDERGLDIPVNTVDNQDNTFRIDFEPKSVGTYLASIFFADQEIPSSPYNIKVVPSIDVSKVHVDGLEKKIPVGKEHEFEIITTGAGKGQVQVGLVGPQGRSMAAKVEETIDGFASKITPYEAGPHTVHVTFGGQPVPGSPFTVEAIPDKQVTVPKAEAGKVKAYGAGLEGGIANSPAEFTLDTRDAGPGGLGLTIEGPSEAKIECFDHNDGTCMVRYWPTEPGEYNINVLYANKPIEKSPFKAQVMPSKRVDVSGIKAYGPGLQPTGVFLESTTDFTVDAKSVTPTGEGKLKAFVTAPSGSRMEVLVNNNKDGTYKCMYTPFEQGPHKLDVTYEGLQIPNSPFNVMATPGCDPTRVKAYGPGLDGGFTNISQAFTVETRGAGQGNLGLAIEGPSEAKMKCRDNRDGSCTVDYLPTCKGSYDINVKFADQHIPGSPFHVGIVDEVNPKRVHVYGKGVDPKGVTANAPTDFTVDASEAGSAPLDVTTTDAVGNKKPVQVRPVQEGIYEASYVPTAEGVQTIDINYAGKPVPGSPYKVRVLPGVDASKVTVSGAGVQPSGVGASLPVSFNVDPRQAGIADLTCIIQDPEGRQIQPNIQRNPDGTYTVTYTPEDVGMYTVTVQYGGQPVPGAPFYVKTSPVGDASKVKVPANLATTVPVGEECVIQLDTGAAGQGNVTCRIHSNADSEADIDIVDNGDGTVSLLYTPRVPGAYTLNIKFGGQPVPQGQITQQAVDPDSEEYQHYLEREAEKLAIEEELFEKKRLRDELASNKMAGLPGEDMIMPEDAQGVHSKSPYHPVDFCIPVGPIFNFVKAVVTTPSGQKAHPKIEDNKNGSVIVRYNPTEVGLHSMDVMYNNQPIQGSPFLFHVDAINSGYVTAHGPGLSHGVSGVPAHFTIITKDAGSGGLALAVEGPSKADIQCMDNNDGTCSVSYLPTSPGEYKIIIKFADKHISGSPFTAKVSGPDMEQKRAQLSVGNSSDVSLNVAESDLSSLTSTIRNPSGIEDPCVLKRLPNGHLGISFTPREIGEHLVNVYRNNTHIPNSPFKIYVGESEIGNASKVKVTGRGLTDGMANQLNEFTVNTKEAGYGGLSLSIEGPSKADIECHDNEDGACRVTYKPTEPGNYIINVKFADEHVPGSPFMVNVGGEPSGRITERITRQQEAADITHVGSQCELSLKIPGTTPYDMEASVTSPSGQTEICDIVEVDKCHYSIKFIPKEMGIHTVSVKHRGMHIPGSPFQFTVGPITDGGSHKVKAIGPGLLRGEVNKPCDFNIYTREAGAGGLSIAIEGPSKAEIEFQDRKDGSCGVTYVCSEPGEYLATVKFNDQHIPDSPFKVHIAPGSGDVQKLMVQSLTEQGLQVNKPAAFTIDLNGAQGKLDARVVSPSGAEDEAIIQERDKDKYAVCFVPRENGVHLIHVRLNHNHIPGSPFRVMVGMGDADPSKVRAYGDGLARGNTGVPCKFIVNTVNAGSGALAVTIDGPSKVQMTCDEVPEGYQFQYTPTAPGDYLVTIKYAGSAIPASPFKAKIEGSAKPDQGPWSETSQCVVETVTKTSTTQQYAAVPKPSTPSDASQVTTQGLLAKAFTNKETTFSVDTSKAGHNFLMVGMMGPVHPCEEICVHHIGRNKYKVKYLVKDPGNYVLVIKWGDEHIPGSPFHVAVQ